jgi:hypothetical protein
MSTYIFSGLILPERAQLSIGPSTYAFTYPPDGTRHNAQVSIVLNQATVYVDTDKDWSVHDLKNIVVQIVRDLTNIIGYIRGYGYDVEIRQVRNRDRNIDYVFGIEIPCIAKRNEGLVLKDEFLRILSLIQGNHGRYISRALDDFSQAMKNPGDTPFYCFRALETLKQLCGYRYKIEGDINQWKKLTEITGYSKEDIEHIKEPAFEARHGLRKPITDDDRAGIFLKTWNIINMFIKRYVPPETDSEES